MSKRNILNLMMLLLPFSLVQAQGSRWQCNIYDYQYDMTAYVDVTMDGVVISDYANYEVAAFCGEECRGVASIEEIPNTEKKYYYLRIRSNQNEGETISFKVYDKAKTKEYVITANTVAFSAQGMQGYPSSPMILGATNSYRLTYKLDGEEYSVDSIAYGTVLVQKEALTKEGYSFSGWSEIPETMPAKDVTITGSFSVNSYNLVYMVDGVEFNKTSVEFGSAITALEAPTKEGYTFSGWSEVPETMPAKDVTIEGTFSVNSYNLVYMVDGGEYNKTSVEFGSAITALEAPTKEGYTFSGWSEVPETMPAKDVTIEGTFSVNSYNLVYMVDGAEYNKTSVEFGSAITALEVPVKEGYAFSGWSEIPETMPAKDVTIEGSFSINTYTITYMVDGEVYATEQIAYGSAIVLKDAPVKEGYIFSGWSEAPETMPAADVVIEGTFTVDGIDAVVTNRLVDVYTLQGVMVKRQVLVEELEQELPTGIYIVNGKKMVVK